MPGKPDRQPFTVEQTAKSVATIRIEIPKQPTTSGWEFWVLIRSDVHHDNPKSRRDLEKKHLDQAKERNAAVIDCGDLFCAMQGKYDKRSSKGDIREEHQCGDYLDALVRTAAEFYRPYSGCFAVIGRGNHESSIKNRHETDLTERLVALMRAGGSQVITGGYSGWVRLLFTRHNERIGRAIWYMHGYGGGGPVTRDMIQANRQGVYVEGADYMVSGHVHEAWCLDYPRIRLTNNGAVEHRPVTYIKCPTYKEEYGEGHGGWHVETGKPPKPLGAWWIRFWWESERLMEQVIRAT